MGNRLLFAFVIILAISACGPPNPAEWTIAVQPVGSPAGPNSSEPQLAVSERGVLVSWIERTGQTTTLKFAERTSSGWTRATTVASGTDWFLSYADVPSVMRKRDGTLVAQWLRETDPRREAYDLMLSIRRTTGKSGLRRFRLITTARSSSTVSHRSSDCRITLLGSCGSTAATATSATRIRQAGR